jgi:hypothetical protein
MIHIKEREREKEQSNRLTHKVKHMQPHKRRECKEKKYDPAYKDLAVSVRKSHDYGNIQKPACTKVL